MTDKSKSNFQIVLLYIFVGTAIGITSLLFFTDTYAAIDPRTKLEHAILASFRDRKLIYGITILPLCVASFQVFKNKPLASLNLTKLYKLIKQKFN